MFDHLYLLAEGQCIYQGNVGGLVPFLSSMGLDCPSYHNPADYGKCSMKFSSFSFIILPSSKSQLSRLTVLYYIMFSDRGI